LVVKIFCCNVYFVSRETRNCRQHNDKEWKFKEQRAKMWENIAGAKRCSRPRGFNITGASAPVAPALPTPLIVNSRRVGDYTDYLDEIHAMSMDFN